jgi:hypothetical protein
MKLRHLLQGAVLLIVAASSQGAPVELLTAKQAALPDPAEPKLPPIAEKALTPGAPSIVFDTPQPGNTITSPFPVKVRFVTTDGAKALPETLKIYVLKMAPISLLSKVQPYLTSAGINMPEAALPSGKYNVRVAIADDKGRQGTMEGTWIVK